MSHDPKFGEPRVGPLGAGSPEEIDNWFTYHPPTGDQVVHYEALRAAGREFAEAITRHAPSSADRTTALRAVRDAVMWANAAIACAPAPSTDDRFTP